MSKKLIPHKNRSRPNGNCEYDGGCVEPAIKRPWRQSPDDRPSVRVRLCQKHERWSPFLSPPNTRAYQSDNAPASQPAELIVRRSASRIEVRPDEKVEPQKMDMEAGSVFVPERPVDIPSNDTVGCAHHIFPDVHLSVDDQRYICRIARCSGCVLPGDAVR